MKYVYSKIQTFLIGSFFLCTVGHGTPIEKMIVEGNQRIEASTITSSLNIQPGQFVTAQDIDYALRTLYATNYFTDVTIEQVGDQLVIKVVENPSINRISYEGNKKVSDKILNEHVKIVPRQLLNKAKIQEEVHRILAIYRAKGYFGAKVVPNIIKREQNRVDIVFDINEGVSTNVKQIRFVGNTKFSSDDLCQVLDTKEYHWWRFFASDDFYDPDRLEADRDKLRKFYLSKGYADFRVISAVAEMVPSSDGFIITFTVEEGERYKFGPVEVKTHIPYLKVEEIQKKIVAKKGDWYSSDLIEKDMSTITNIAGDYGFAFVEVRPNVAKDDAAHSIKLTYELVEGPKVFINKIKIVHNTRTVDSVIRRQFLVAEGDPYNMTKIRDSNRRLENLGFFKKTDIKQTPVPNHPDKTDLQVEVQEQNTGEINFSAGYNTSTGPLGMITFSERNLFGRAYGFYSRLYYGKKSKNISVDVEDPYFLSRELLAGVGLVRAQNDMESESSYKQDSTGGRVWTAYYLAEFLTQKWTYSLVSERIGSVPATAAPQIRSQVGKKTGSMISHTISYDRRDFRYAPKDGYLLSMTNDYSGLGGDIKFFRNKASAARYYTIFDDLTFSLEGEAGAIQGMAGQTLRVSDKFMLGGESLRGFEPAGVGPRYKRGFQENLGGDRMFMASVEGKFPLGLSKDYGVNGVVFVDSGTTWDSKESSSTVYNFKSLRAATGFGFGWASPMGVIRIDFGFPLMKKPGDKTSVLLIHFGTGRF